MAGIRLFLEDFLALEMAFSVRQSTHAKELDCGTMLADLLWCRLAVASADRRCSTLWAFWFSEKSATAFNQSVAGV